MDSFKKILCLLLAFHGALLARDDGVLADEVEVDILFGRNLMVAICQVNSNALDTPFEKLAHNGMIPYGLKSSFLLKNSITLHELIYVSPIFKIKKAGEFNIKSLWTLSNNVGSTLEINEPLSPAGEKFVVIAEGVTINDDFVFIVRAVEPIEYKKNLLRVLAIRMKYDEMIWKEYKTLIKK